MAELVSIKRNVDVSPGQAAPAVFHCSQGDAGSKIILGLLNNGTAYSIPSGVTVTIEGSESNGSIFTPISATASGSDITFYLTGEMTAVAGPAICQAVLKSGSNILGTANFTLEVESSPMGADAPPVFTDAGWTWMLNKLNTEFVPALGNETIIDAIDSKADQSDLTNLSNTVAGHTGSITALNNSIRTINDSIVENRRNIAKNSDEINNLSDALESSKQIYNLLNYKYYSFENRGNPATINNRTYSVQSNGEILVTGKTSSQTSSYYIAYASMIIPAGTYIFLLNNDVTGYASVDVRTSGNTSTICSFTPEGTEYSFSEDTNVTIRIIITSGSTLPDEGILIQPMMVRKGEYYGYIAPWASLANYVPQIISNIERNNVQIENNSESIESINGVITASRQKMNLLSFEYYSNKQRGNPCTINGITYNTQKNGEIVATGTASSNSSVYIAHTATLSGWNNIVLPAGIYVCLLDDDISAYCTAKIMDAAGVTIISYGNRPTLLTITTDTVVRISFTISKNTVLPNSGITIKPIIARQDTFSGYVPPYGYEYDSVKNINNVVSHGWQTPYGLKSIIHRGCGNSINNVPENTEPGFKWGRAHGFLSMETDVKFTADTPSVPVLIHDDTINRTARNVDGSEINMDIAVADHTLAQLLEYDYGIKYGEQYAGTKILTLSQGLALFKQLGCEMYLELKGAMLNDDGHAEALVAAVRNSGYADHVIFISGTLTRLTKVVQFFPESDYVVIHSNEAGVADSIESDIQAIRNKGGTGKVSIFINSHNDTVLPEIIEACKQHGVNLLCGAISGSVAIENLDSYISGVITNDIHPQKAYLDILI